MADRRYGKISLYTEECHFPYSWMHLSSAFPCLLSVFREKNLYVGILYVGLFCFCNVLSLFYYLIKSR